MLIKSTLIPLILLLAPSMLIGVTVPWDGGDGNWDDLNWNGGGPKPASGDDAQIHSNADSVTINSNNTVASLSVSYKKTGPELRMTGSLTALTINGDFNIATSGTSGQDGNYTQVDGTLNITGDWNIATVNNATATIDIQGGTVNILTGTINLSTDANPKNTSFFNVASGAVINADSIHIGDQGELSGEGSINVNTVTIDAGGTIGPELTVITDDLILASDATLTAILHDGSPPAFDITTVNNILSLGSGGTWTLELEDDNGFDDINSPSEEFDIWTGFNTLTYGDTTVTSGSGIITNVTIISGSPGPLDSQIDGATLEYRFIDGVGEAYLTNVVPLPNAFMLGTILLLLLALRHRPAMRRAVKIATS